MRFHSWSEEKVNHVLKTDGDKLFKVLLINKIFSKQILSWNFKMEFWTGMEISWLKINNCNSLFLWNYKLLNSATILSPDKTAVEQVGVKNNKIDGS